SNALISLSNFSHRCDVNNRLGCYLKRLPEPQMRSALDELAELLDVDLHSGGVRMLTWSQIRSFVEAGMDVGSHGVSHICMSRLGKQRAVDELCDSKRLIEKEIGRPVRHFAFPNGTKEDFSDELRQEAKAAGYSSVASAEPGVNVPRSTDPLNLQRVGLIGSPEETLLYLERLFYSSSDRQVAR
ncbi:MAG: polysaccharide deacetylase family protein, partial [Gammaproteobacteria bacterium]|nr:polysaccharide deacetylase family protein [Gammaproteobacteria bacterium]